MCLINLAKQYCENGEAATKKFFGGAGGGFSKKAPCYSKIIYLPTNLNLLVNTITKEHTMNIILASKSPRRKEIL